MNLTQNQIKALEMRVTQLEKNNAIIITMESLKSFFKKILIFSGWAVFILLIIWFTYIFLYGLNARYGFGNSIIKAYHIWYG